MICEVSERDVNKASSSSWSLSKSESSSFHVFVTTEEETCGRGTRTFGVRLGLISFSWLNSNCKNTDVWDFSLSFCLCCVLDEWHLTKTCFSFFYFSKFMYKALEIPWMMNFLCWLMANKRFLAMTSSSLRGLNTEKSEFTLVWSSCFF